MSSSSTSFFRTLAWVSAWLETWGQSKSIKLHYLKGGKNPLEVLYCLKHKIKGLIPVKSLLVAGYGFSSFNPPRAEYNSIDNLIALYGSTDSFAQAIKKISWNQFVLTDCKSADHSDLYIASLAAALGCRPLLIKSETAYSVKAADFTSYKSQLSASTRAIYFNRRSKLIEQGNVDFIEAMDPDSFFESLNHFHVLRWGQPCYSSDSIQFFKLFISRLPLEGGRAIMQYMRINGEVVSALFDIEWNGVRTNLQSGFYERRFGRLAIGSIHIGYAIEQAINQGLTYDLLAGRGKHSDYKRKVATDSTQMLTYVFARGWLGFLYSLYGK